jgi:hypothetical protein
LGSNDVKKLLTAFFIFPLIALLLPFISYAFDDTLEKDLQRALHRDKASVKKAKQKVKKGGDMKEEIAAFIGHAEGIKTKHSLILERFRKRREEVKHVNFKAEERHREMEEGYKKAMEEYLSRVDKLPSHDKVSQKEMEDLNSFLERIIPKRRKPLIGTLPYRNLNYPSREPSQNPPIKPAYKGGTTTVSPDDTKSTQEAPISPEIASLAQSLNWNPVSIYEYVKNSIETEWYWGCMKGAEETLIQRSGNDCDQAALLVALLRASGFPTRYVRGTIEFFASDGKPIEKTKNLTGIEDPWKIAEFFQKAGVPYKPIIAGGAIKNFEIEHVWVESLIPYANYRGAIIDEHGKTWLGLDTSVKVKGYTYNNPTDIFQQSAVSSRLSAIRDEYFSTLQSQTPLEYMKQMLSDISGQPSESYELKRTLMPEVLNVLPASMQFTEVRITHEYIEIPDDLKHKVRFTVADTYNAELFSSIFSTMELSNKQIAITYEPETVEDQQIIDYYGGLDNTPAYLVRLRPVLKVDGERTAVGTNGLPMGADNILTIEVISPCSAEKITSTHITGNLAAIGIVSQKALGAEQTAIAEEDDAEAILFKETNRYIDRWNDAEEELASLMHLVLSRPIPAVMTVGGVIDVAYVFGTPHGFTWKGVYADANLRAIEVAPSHPPLPQGGADRQKRFMEWSALQGSILENRIFEDDFQVESISTAKLFSIVGSRQNTADRMELLTIDRLNIDSVLSTLPYDETIIEDIQNAVNQNLTVKIPEQEITYFDWTGTGHIKENSNTEESGYMLSGMIAGGMTAVSPDRWANQALREKLGRLSQGGFKPIAITSPKSGTVVSTPVIDVKGTVLDTLARVEVNGVPAVITGNTFTATGIMLNEGVNNITATATNTAGKTASDTVFITYTIPILTYITFPYDGANLSVTPIDVEGIVSDPSASVEIKGINATVRGDGRFIAPGVALSEGSNLITANASKGNGQTGTHSITVNYHSAPVPPMYISITSPSNNATINRPSVIVRGTVTTSAQEVSIKVNGILADIYGSQFVANNVPLTEGNNTIIANALDSNGAVARAEVSVNAITTGPYITLSANITSGIPPLATYFSVSTGIPNAITTYQIDFEGDGVIDYSGDTFDNMTYTYTTEGIFYPTLTITDDQGNMYSDTIAITVLNKAAIDALLSSKWEGMKGALASGDIEAALRVFVEEKRDMYRYNFNLLNSILPTIIIDLGNIRLARVTNDVAECKMLAVQEGVEYSFYVEFVRDSNGIWNLRFF